MNIPLVRNPYNDRNLYTKKSVDILPGITVLVGCNGCGKTTMIREFGEYFDKNKIKYVKFDNLHDGGSEALGRAAFHQNYSLVANMFSSSEGEKIMLNITQFASKIGRGVREVLSCENKKFFVLLDAVDSGFSIDNICEFKEFIKDTVLPDAKNKGVEMYLIIVANEYEMCRGEQCLDVKHCKYIEFTDYEDYRKFILESRKLKDKSRSK